MNKKKRAQDMHRADIRAELMKKGITFSQLGIENGLSKTTVEMLLINLIKTVKKLSQKH